MSKDDDDGWATGNESEDGYHDAVTDIEEIAPEAESATSAQELPSTTQAVEAEVKRSSSAASQAGVPSTDKTPPASQGEERVVGDTAKKGVADMLSTPIEVKLHLSSTPMDILLWSLVVILSLLVAVLGVALAVLWSRVQ
ncbi:hypothetical protein FB451DRAFT_1401837 [Mycena latifolia]|nr:hypothetical protein FB451DRAFT_1401837 [Mycena latifolia]